MRVLRNPFLAPVLALALAAGGIALADTPPGQDLHFVSLKSASANGRVGPGLDQTVRWIYERPELPLEVLSAQGPWRRVRDPDGAEVWMLAAHLQPRRTVLVTAREGAALRRAPQPRSHVLAHLSPGVIGALTGCEGGWRRVAVGGRVGWVVAETLWAGEDCAGL